MDTVLRSLGLTKNEIIVYRCLLMSPGLAGEVTARTGIHRRNVYDSMERLVKKGLVGYVTRNNRKHFEATDPKHFLYLIKKEKEELESKERALAEVLPQILLLKNSVKENARVTVFEGKRGLINLLEDVLKTRRTNLVFSTTKIRFIRQYLEWFHKRRVRLKIVDRLILNEREKERASRLSRMPCTHVRVMRDEFDTPLAINVYANKVGMLIFSDNPIAILIEDRSVANSFKNYFELLWKMARQV